MSFETAIRIGVVGATGLVGENFLKLVETSPLNFQEIRLFASERSLGKRVSIRGREEEIQTLQAHCFQDLDLVFFSAGSSVSREWAGEAMKAGAFVVDNSSAFRMDEGIDLIVPEINGSTLKENQSPRIIANPNCSTIQLVIALAPLKKFGFRDIKVATYQALSGAGRKSMQSLKDGTAPQDCIPQIGEIDGEGFCEEELKILRETRKILSSPKLSISAATVRAPIANGHSETVWVTFEKSVAREDIETAFQSMPGLSYQEKSLVTANAASGKRDVFISRLRREPYSENTWCFWVVADNLLKGAALNSLQIAEQLFDRQ